MTIKTLIEILFPTKTGVTFPEEDVNKRINEIKDRKYDKYNSKQIVEYIISGNTPSPYSYSFESYLDENFSREYSPKVGDVVVIRDTKSKYQSLLEGIITKQEGKDYEVMHKTGTGPYALIEIDNLKDFEKQAYKGRFMEFYRPIETKKEIINESREEIIESIPQKTYLTTTGLNVA